MEFKDIILDKEVLHPKTAYEVFKIVQCVTCEVTKALASNVMSKTKITSSVDRMRVLGGLENVLEIKEDTDTEKKRAQIADEFITVQKVVDYVCTRLQIKNVAIKR